MFSGLLIFFGGGSFSAFLGSIKLCLGLIWGPKSLLYLCSYRQINFFCKIFVSWLFDLLLLGVILSLQGPYRAIFRAGVEPKKTGNFYLLRFFVFWLFKLRKGASISRFVGRSVRRKIKSNYFKSHNWTNTWEVGQTPKILFP